MDTSNTWLNYDTVAVSYYLGRDLTRIQVSITYFAWYIVDYIFLQTTNLYLSTCLLAKQIIIYISLPITHHYYK